MSICNAICAMKKNIMKNKLVCKTENRREFILEVAKEMFSTHGFHNTSIRDIARAVDMNTSMVSYYFQNKENLLAEILDRIANDLCNLICTVQLKPNFREQLMALVQESTAYFCSAPDNLRLLLQSLIIEVSHSVFQKSRRIVFMFQKFFIDIIDNGKIDGYFSTKEESIMLYHFFLGTVNNALQNLEITGADNKECHQVKNRVNLFIIKGLSYYLDCDLIYLAH